MFQPVADLGCPRAQVFGHSKVNWHDPASWRRASIKRAAAFERSRLIIMPKPARSEHFRARNGLHKNFWHIWIYVLTQQPSTTAAEQDLLNASPRHICAAALLAGVLMEMIRWKPESFVNKVCFCVQGEDRRKWILNIHSRGLREVLGWKSNQPAVGAPMALCNATCQGLRALAHRPGYLNSYCGSSYVPVLTSNRNTTRRP